MKMCNTLWISDIQLISKLVTTYLTESVLNTDVLLNVNPGNLNFYQSRFFGAWKC